MNCLHGAFGSAFVEYGAIDRGHGFFARLSAKPAHDFRVGLCVDLANCLKAALVWFKNGYHFAASIRS